MTEICEIGFGELREVSPQKSRAILAQEGHQIHRRRTLAALVVQVSMRRGLADNWQPEPARKKECRRQPQAFWTIGQAGGRIADDADPGYSAGGFERERLGNRCAEFMSDGAHSIDSQRVEQPDQPLCMPVGRVVRGKGSVAPSEAEQVDDDHPMSRRQLCDNVEPEMAGRWKAVNQQHRLSRTASSSGVVVQALAVQIDEFAAHRGENDSSAKGRVVRASPA